MADGSDYLLTSDTRKPSVASKVSLWWAHVSLGLSSAVLLMVGLCFLMHWDAVAVITLPPFWAWAIVGLTLNALAWWSRGGWRPKVLLLLWLGTSLIFSDDLYGWAMTPLRAGAERAEIASTPRIRVASLNCAGQVKAMKEIGAWKPDIVLLQESPSSNDVARICQEWFGQEGGFLYGLDCSIIVRGQIKTVVSPRSFRFNWGEVTLPRGDVVNVVSVRLIPPDTRFDLWSSDCWTQHMHSRQLRRKQLQELTNLLPPVAGSRSMMIGGDFNAPAGDAIFQLFNGLLKECFREAGRGWGNTGINDLPIMRPDQIWINPSSIALKAWAVKTINSDHRMVICDLVLR